MRKLDRSQFLRAGAAGALATFAGAGAATASQGPPLTPQGDDWGFLQWGATAELVAVAFWDRALREPGLGERARRSLRAARSADAAHLRHFSATLGEEAPTDDDYKVLLPKSAFKSRAGILALAEEIKEYAVRVYLGGVMEAVDPATRLLLGQLVVNDTQHLDSLRALSGKPGPSASLRDPLTLEPAGLWLDRFLRVRSS